MISTRPPSRVRRLAPLAAFVLLLAACGRDPAAEKQRHFERGESWFAQGRFPEAIIEYRSAIQIDPAFGRARFRLGEAYAKASDPEAAFPEYVRAADLLPDDPQAQLVAGQYLLLATRYEEARTRARAVIEREPRNSAAHVLLGNALAGLQDYDAAAASLEKAIEFDPNRGLTRATLGAIETARGRTPEAEAAYARAIEVDPTSPEAHLALGSYRLASGDTGGAEQAFRTVLTLDPKNALALRALSSMFVNMNEAGKAEPHLRQLADERDDTAAGFLLTEVLLAAGREAEAIARLEKMAAVPRQFADATLRLATIDYVAGRRPGALARVAALLEQQPRSAKALALRGRFRLDAGDVEAALADLQLAVNSDPKYEAGHFWLAQALLQRRRGAEARASLLEVLRLDPRYVPAQVELSRVYLGARDYDQAIATAQQAVRASPNHLEARLALVRAFVGAGQADNAAEELRPVAAQLPKEPRVQMLEGQIRLVRRDPKAAEQRFIAALEAEPTSYEALGGLVASRLAAGNVAGALAAANTVLARTPTDARSLVLAARAYGEARDFKNAEAVLKRAIEADPALLEAYSMLGQLYVADQRLEEALREFQRLSERQPTAVGPKTVVAVLHHMANRRPEAKKAYEAVLRVDPGAVVAANNLAWMKVEDGEDLTTALQLAQAAKVRAPQSPEVSDTLGLIYYRRNLFAFSAAAFEDAVRYAPQNPEYHYRLGLALSRNDDPSRSQGVVQEGPGHQSDVPRGGRRQGPARGAAVAPLDWPCRRHRVRPSGAGSGADRGRGAHHVDELRARSLPRQPGEIGAGGDGAALVGTEIEQPHDGRGKGLGLVGHRAPRADDAGEALAHGGRGHHRHPRGQRLEHFVLQAARRVQRGHRDGGAPQVVAGVRHGPGDRDAAAGQGPHHGRGLTADDLELRRGMTGQDARPHLGRQPGRAGLVRGVVHHAAEDDGARRRRRAGRLEVVHVDAVGQDPHVGAWGDGGQRLAFLLVDDQRRHGALGGPALEGREDAGLAPVGPALGRRRHLGQPPPLLRVDIDHVEHQRHAGQRRPQGELGHAAAEGDDHVGAAGGHDLPQHTVDGRRVEQDVGQRLRPGERERDAQPAQRPGHRRARHGQAARRHGAGVPRLVAVVDEGHQVDVEGLAEPLEQVIGPDAIAAVGSVGQPVREVEHPHLGAWSWRERISTAGTPPTMA